MWTAAAYRLTHSATYVTIEIFFVKRVRKSRYSLSGYEITISRTITLQRLFHVSIKK